MRCLVDNFHGNLDFYNHPDYRKANVKVQEAHLLLMGLGMTEEQAFEWIKGWLYPVDGD